MDYRAQHIIESLAAVAAAPTNGRELEKYKALADKALEICLEPGSGFAVPAGLQSPEEQAAHDIVWMAGPEKGHWNNGPNPALSQVVGSMDDGDFLRGCSPRGKILAEGRIVDGALRWVDANTDFLKTLRRKAAEQIYETADLDFAGTVQAQGGWTDGGSGWTRSVFVLPDDAEDSENTVTRTFSIAFGVCSDQPEAVTFEGEDVDFEAPTYVLPVGALDEPETSFEPGF